MDETTATKTKLLLLQRQIYDVQNELEERKRMASEAEDDFVERETALQNMNSELQENMIALETVFAENDAKRQRALKRASDESRAATAKSSEILAGLKQYEELKAEMALMERERRKLQKYHDFLVIFHNENAQEFTDIKSFIERYRTLENAKESLLSNQRALVDKVDALRQQLSQDHKQYASHIILQENEIGRLRTALEAAKSENIALQQSTEENTSQRSRLCLDYAISSQSINTLYNRCIKSSGGQILKHSAQDADDIGEGLRNFPRLYSYVAIHQINVSNFGGLASVSRTGEGDKLGNEQEHEPKSSSNEKSNFMSAAAVPAVVFVPARAPGHKAVGTSQDVSNVDRTTSLSNTSTFNPTSEKVKNGTLNVGSKGGKEETPLVDAHVNRIKSAHASTLRNMDGTVETAPSQEVTAVMQKMSLPLAFSSGIEDPSSTQHLATLISDSTAVLKFSAEPEKKRLSEAEEALASFSAAGAAKRTTEAALKLIVVGSYIRDFINIKKSLEEYAKNGGVEKEALATGSASGSAVNAVRSKSGAATNSNLSSSVLKGSSSGLGASEKRSKKKITSSSLPMTAKRTEKSKGDSKESKSLQKGTSGLSSPEPRLQKVDMSASHQSLKSLISLERRGSYSSMVSLNQSLLDSSLSLSQSFSRMDLGASFGSKASGRFGGTGRRQRRSSNRDLSELTVPELVVRNLENQGHNVYRVASSIELPPVMDVALPEITYSRRR